MADSGTVIPLPVRPFGHDFGTTRFGVNLAAPPQPDCTCDRHWLTRDVIDGSCPVHGLHAIIRELTQREAEVAAP